MPLRRIYECIGKQCVLFLRDEIPGGMSGMKKWTYDMPLGLYRFSFFFFESVFVCRGLTAPMGLRCSFVKSTLCRLCSTFPSSTSEHCVNKQCLKNSVEQTATSKMWGLASCAPTLGNHMVPVPLPSRGAYTPLAYKSD